MCGGGPEEMSIASPQEASGSGAWCQLRTKSSGEDIANLKSVACFNFPREEAKTAAVFTCNEC